MRNMQVDQLHWYTFKKIKVIEIKWKYEYSLEIW